MSDITYDLTAPEPVELTEAEINAVAGGREEVARLLDSGELLADRTRPFPPLRG